MCDTGRCSSASGSARSSTFSLTLTYVCVDVCLCVCVGGAVLLLGLHAAALPHLLRDGPRRHALLGGQGSTMYVCTSNPNPLPHPNPSPHPHSHSNPNPHPNPNLIPNPNPNPEPKLLRDGPRRHALLGGQGR